MVPDCSVDNTTAELNALTGDLAPAFQGFYSAGFQCVSALPTWQATAANIESMLLCGFQDVSSDGLFPNQL